MKAAIAGGALIVIVILAWIVLRFNEDGRVSPANGNQMSEEIVGAGTGAPLADVTVPETLSAESMTGKTYYEAVCSACHGANAAGQDGVAPPLVHVIYEPSHHGDAAFYSAARNGVASHHWPFGNMPPVEEPLTDGEIGSIVAYVRELQRANGIN